MIEKPKRKYHHHVKRVVTWTQFVAAFWVAAWFGWKFVKKGDAELVDIAVSGLLIAACFTPSIFNALLSRFKKKE